MPDDIGAEDLGRRSIAEAFSWGCVETCAEDTQIVLRKGLGIGVAAYKAPEPLVRIFDAAFLPWGLRIAEPRASAQLGLQVGPADELRAAIEGNRAARGYGQGAQGRGNL